MKTSEGKITKLEKKLYSVQLTELDIEVLLGALGYMQNHQYDTGKSTKGTAYLINKIYRAMGVKL